MVAKIVDESACAWSGRLIREGGQRTDDERGPVNE